MTRTRTAPTHPRNVGGRGGILPIRRSPAIARRKISRLFASSSASGPSAPNGLVFTPKPRGSLRMNPSTVESSNIAPKPRSSPVFRRCPDASLIGELHSAFHSPRVIGFQIRVHDNNCRYGSPDCRRNHRAYSRRRRCPPTRAANWAATFFMTDPSTHFARDSSNRLNSLSFIERSISRLASATVSNAGYR